MKIIVQIFAYPEGGIGTHIIDICNSQISNKYKLILVSNFSKKDKKFEKFLNEKKDNIELVDLQINKKPSFTDIKNIIKLFNIFKNRKEEFIFHGHGSKGGLYSRIIGKLLKCKVLYTPHGGSLHLNYGKINNLIYSTIEKFLYFFTDKIIFESNYSKNKFLNKILNSKNDSNNKLVVNYNGVMINNCINKKSKKKDNNFIIHSYGTLRYIKGHDILIKAIYNLKKKYEDINIKVFIYGDGEEKSNLETLIRNLQLSDTIKLCGYVDNIHNYIYNCDLLIHPSRIESLPYTILEAMSKGIPVIASNVGGISEIISDGYNGFLFEKESVESLIDKIIFIINNSQLIYKIQQNAVLTIKNKFNKNKMIHKLMNLYQE